MRIFSYHSRISTPLRAGHVATLNHTRMVDDKQPSTIIKTQRNHNVQTYKNTKNDPQPIA